MLTVVADGLVRVRGTIQSVVPPDVTLVVPRDLLTRAPDHEHLLYRAFARDGLIDHGLECRRVATAIPAVGGDDDLGAGVGDAGP